MFLIRESRFRQRPIISTLMVILSIVLLPLRDSSGSRVNGQRQENYSNAHAQIQYPSNSQESKGKKAFELNNT